MPAERARIGQSVEAINELSGGGLDSSGVMEWLFKEVKYSPSSEINLGAKKIPLPGGLYESYMMYAEAHGIESDGPCRFVSTLARLTLKPFAYLSLATDGDRLGFSALLPSVVD